LSSRNSGSQFNQPKPHILVVCDIEEHIKIIAAAASGVKKCRRQYAIQSCQPPDRPGIAYLRRCHPTPVILSQAAWRQIETDIHTTHGD